MGTKIARASSGGGPKLITKTITYTAGGTGANGTTTNIFVVTGEIIAVYVMAFCTTDLTQSGATPSLVMGVTGDVDDFVATTIATNIDAGQFWASGASIPNLAAIPDAMKDIVTTDNITCTVTGSNNISAGVIRYDLYWLPLSPGGLAVPA